MATFNLPADLSEVRHPLENFGVSCLVSMRGLQRAERKRGGGDNQLFDTDRMTDRHKSSKANHTTDITVSNSHSTIPRQQVHGVKFIVILEKQIKN